MVCQTEEGFDVIGERIAALEGIGEMAREALEKGVEVAGTGAGKEPEARGSVPKGHEPAMSEREKAAGMDLGM